MNRPAKGFIPTRGRGPFFALVSPSRRTRGGDPRASRAMIPPEDYEGASGSPAPTHGLPALSALHVRAPPIPLGQVVLADPDVPVEVTLQAFNPLVPADRRHQRHYPWRSCGTC